MNRKKLDDRIKKTIELAVHNGHRSLVILLGSKAKDQVVLLHQMLSQAQVRTRPSVLWCYKSRETLGFSTHRQKRMKQLKKKARTGEAVDADDPFDLFISATNIRWCYYNETTRILGQTFGMLVLQDFEAITPNLLARTVETVEGGGLVVLLLSSLESLQGLHDMAMDAHEKFRTSAHQTVVSRFNRRFILSLANCSACLTLDDKLNVISSVAAPQLEEKAGSNSESQLKTLVTSLIDTQPAHSLVSCCKTLEQAKAVLQFIQVLADRTAMRSTVALTASRGRGKSAALGLAIAASIGLGYSSITVTSPAPENLTTCFEFIIKGLNAMHYEQHTDYDIVYTQGPNGKYISRISIFKDHRQSIRYVSPNDSNGSAELVVIDEAAAIPLPTVKKLLGPHLTFMASTVHGYEGTGRALSLKLVRQLRSGDAPLYELTLNESIRYKPNDPVESWLNKLLCLDVDVDAVQQGSCPDPKDCQLYYIDRDTLFSMNPTSESFLRQLMALYTASHYKNSPNDLQMMCDAPAHSLFCLLAPRSKDKPSKVPRVVTFLQVCFEGQIPKNYVEESLGRGRRAAGDLIPWTISQQFNDSAFASLSGARVIRIATDPGMQGMGYGSAAIKFIMDYYSGLVPFEGKPTEQTLLSTLNERKAEKLDYLGVSFGLTPELFKFWHKLNFVPVYIRQTANETTGEHSAIVLKTIKPSDWLTEFANDFQRRFLNLLAFQFRTLPVSLALDVVNSCSRPASTNQVMSLEQLRCHLSPHDVQRLVLYSRSLVDYHLVTDLMPVVARLLFTGQLGNISLSALQSALILSIGLQCKLVDQLESEIAMEASQLLGLFNRAVRKITKVIESIEETAIESTLEPPPENISCNKMKPLAEELEKELEIEAAKIRNEDRIAKALVRKPKHMFKVKSLHPAKRKKGPSSQNNH